MSAVKERIIGAVTVMSDEAASILWKYISSQDLIWDAIPAEEPDEQDRQMLAEIEADPDCQEFVSADEAMRMLGIK